MRRRQEGLAFWHHHRLQAVRLLWECGRLHAEMMHLNMNDDIWRWTTNQRQENLTSSESHKLVTEELIHWRAQLTTKVKMELITMADKGFQIMKPYEKGKSAPEVERRHVIMDIDAKQQPHTFCATFWRWDMSICRTDLFQRYQGDRVDWCAGQPFEASPGYY